MSIIDLIYNDVVTRDPDQPEFHQAVKEVLESLEPVLEAHPEYKKRIDKERRIIFLIFIRLEKIQIS